MMKKLLINIIAAAAMLVPLSLSAQDTRVQESRKAKLEKEIALIDKQLKENAAKSSNALTTLNLVRKKVADRKELVAESDREIAALTGRINAKQKDVDEPLEYARLYLEGNLQMWVDAEDSLEL